MKDQPQSHIPGTNPALAWQDPLAPHYPRQITNNASSSTGYGYGNVSAGASGKRNQESGSTALAQHKNNLGAFGGGHGVEGVRRGEALENEEGRIPHGHSTASYHQGTHLSLRPFAPTSDSLAVGKDPLAPRAGTAMSKAVQKYSRGTVDSTHKRYHWLESMMKESPKLFSDLTLSLLQDAAAPRNVHSNGSNFKKAHGALSTATYFAISAMSGGDGNLHGYKGNSRARFKPGVELSSSSLLHTALVLLSSLLGAAPVNLAATAFGKESHWAALRQLVESYFVGQKSLSGKTEASVLVNNREDLLMSVSCVICTVCEMPGNAALFFEYGALDSVLDSELLQAHTFPLQLPASIAASLPTLDTPHPVVLLSFLQVIVGVMSRLPKHQVTMQRVLHWFMRHQEMALNILTWIGRLPLQPSRQNQQEMHRIHIPIDPLNPNSSAQHDARASAAIAHDHDAHFDGNQRFTHDFDQLHALYDVAAHFLQLFAAISPAVDKASLSYLALRSPMVSHSMELLTLISKIGINEDPKNANGDDSHGSGNSYPDYLRQGVGEHHHYIAPKPDITLNKSNASKIKIPLPSVEIRRRIVQAALSIISSDPITVQLEDRMHISSHGSPGFSEDLNFMQNKMACIAPGLESWTEFQRVAHHRAARLAECLQSIGTELLQFYAVGNEQPQISGNAMAAKRMLVMCENATMLFYVHLKACCSSEGDRYILLFVFLVSCFSSVFYPFFSFGCDFPALKCFMLSVGSCFQGRACRNPARLQWFGF